jgi:hypothetical protein
MPFADKFRAMMGFPFPGDTLGAFTVESVEVGHEGIAPGLYVYPVRIVIQGPGGVSGASKALRPLLSQHCTTFSGYGNPYQLWFGKASVESLGEGRYAATVQGAGARVHLEEDLARFLDHLAAEGALKEELDTEARAALVSGYLEHYQGEIARLVNRYRGKLRRAR